jgi:hypothetical protein
MYTDMDTDTQTSFIPKHPLAEERVRSGGPSINIFLLIALVLFIASIVGAGFVYFYKTSLETQITESKKNLEENRAAFEPEFISNLQTVDRRLKSASQVLANHMTVSPLLDVIGKSTLKSVQFTRFTHTIVGSGANAKIEVKMSGKAVNYDAIALQSDSLTQSK